MTREKYLDEYKLGLISMSNEYLLFELGSIANKIGRFEQMNEHDQNTETILERYRKQYYICKKYILEQRLK